MNGELRSIDRYGRWVLLAVFVVLLGGRFTLDRLGDFPAWDLRWAGVLVIGGLAFAWATTAREKTEPAARLGWVAGFFAAWGSWLIFTALWAPPLARLDQYVPDMLLLLGLVGAGWAAANRISHRMVQSVWWWLLAAGVAYVASAWVEGPDAQGRYSALGGGPNVFVRVMALAAVAALFLAVVRRRYWPLLLVPVFVAGAFLSGSRGGLLSLAVIVLVGAVPLLRRMSSKLRGALALLTVPVVLLAPFVVNPAWFSGIQARLVEQTIEQRYDSGRSEILEGAWRLFLEHPVAGAGIDGYYALIGSATGREYPHNLLLATAAEAGLVGALLLFGALAAAAVALWRSRPLSVDALGFSLCALFMLIASMFSGDYYDSRFVWFFVGLAVITARRSVGGGEGAAPAGAAGRTEPVVGGVEQQPAR